MLSVSRPVERTPLPPGYRHGISTPITSGLRLYCDSSRLESETPSRVEAYPSPPMSGSPPLPPTAALGGHASGGAAPFNTRYDGSYGRWPTEQTHFDPDVARDRPHGLIPLSRSYPQETPSRSIRRLSENLPSVSRFNTQDPRGILPGAPNHSPAGSAAYGTPTSVRALAQDSHSSLPRVTSPKSQRKAKGHVASACLPCKRAHLRCDAQRPCSRCVSNGKEANCKDIQHKKRGRPRLRDERDARLDSARFPLTHDLDSRRHLHIHPTSAARPQYDDDASQQHPLPPVEYAQGDPVPGPKFLQRVLSSERTLGQPGQPHGTNLEEPVAYLNMRMEFMKVSSTFHKAVGSIPGLVGRKLVDVTIPKEQDRILGLGEAMMAEQKRLEPNYLPPIFDRGEQVAGRLGLTAGAVDERQLSRRDYITFVAADGHWRAHNVRLGILKEATFYFVTLFLDLPAHDPYLAPGAHLQNTAVHTAPRTNNQSRVMTQPRPPPPTPVSTAIPGPFEADHRRFSDGPGLTRQPASVSASRRTPSSPHTNSYQPMYSPSSHGGDYTRPPPLQVPRSELGASNAEQSFTLPPIRSLPEQGTGEEASNTWQRDSHQRRVTIGGLIERPETTQGRWQ